MAARFKGSQYVGRAWKSSGTVPSSCRRALSGHSHNAELGPQSQPSFGGTHCCRILSRAHHYVLSDCKDVVKENAVARNSLQFARLLSTVSEGASSNDKRSTTEASKQSEEAPNKNCQKATEAAVKSDKDATIKTEEKAKAGEDVIKSEAEEKKLRDLLKETQALFKEKDREVAQMKQQVLTHLAEVENVRGRTRRDAESIKQHAIETFATDLLDMADNLCQAAANVPESIRTEESDSNTSANAKLLKSLLVGVDMTEKQLMKIFNKFGVEKYDPVGEKYDPQHHLAITEVEDETKEPQTIVNIVKSGYFFKDKLIRPAEVNIVKKRAEAT